MYELRLNIRITEATTITDIYYMDVDEHDRPITTHGL